MIELLNVNKYYNRGKKNQLHVINNTSLKFDDKGNGGNIGQLRAAVRPRFSMLSAGLINRTPAKYL